jgi:hypothetical protein
MAKYSEAELCWIKAKLTQWGRRCRALGLGYPGMSATEKARIGRGGSFDGPCLPPDLEEIDHAVTVSPRDYRIVLIERYTKHGNAQIHAARLLIAESTYFARLKSAERHINNSLAGRSCQVPSGFSVAI